MRLLDTNSLTLHEFQGDAFPPYAILSHTWAAEEVSYQLLSTPEAKSLAGYQKIVRCCSLAAAQGWRYVWIDTCCIDKTSSAELSEAINSMWRWYEQSGVCFAYLADCVKEVHEGSDPSLLNAQTLREFQDSRWFTRGWTLQELLAPAKVVFYDAQWREIGDKDDLQDLIWIATLIGPLHLRKPRTASVAAKLSWMSRRQTTRPEDIAYSLLGLFDVYMPMIYGEGSNAFLRLQQEIVKSSNDESIFAWTDDSLLESGMLAPSAAAFASSGDVIPFQHPGIRRTPYSITNFGLAIETDMMRERTQNDQQTDACWWKMLLACTRGFTRQPLMITLHTVGQHTVRCNVGSLTPCRHVIPGSVHQLIYVKSTYRFKTFDWSEPPLAIRWNRLFEEQFKYDGCGPVSKHPVTAEMNQDGMRYSDYAGKTVRQEYWARASGPFLSSAGATVTVPSKSPALILILDLEPGELSFSSQIRVLKNSKHPSQRWDEDTGAYEFHNLRLGSEMTVPLRDGLHLRVEVGMEEFGEGSLFVNLKLLASTRGVLSKPGLLQRLGSWTARR
ncbi:MAG: hypothetical protein LQ348_002416 [Seirophora lacunosa]|nr:MAG: hypothetical protein LQ348_002416 [Seirophora lacunosa]